MEDRIYKKIDRINLTIQNIKQTIIDQNTTRIKILYDARKILNKYLKEMKAQDIEGFSYENKIFYVETKEELLQQINYLNFKIGDNKEIPQRAPSQSSNDEENTS